MHTLNICVITASSPEQEKTFAVLLAKRFQHGLYPREIDFITCSDPVNGRVGSGGGTLNALQKVIEKYKVSDPQIFFQNNRILIIHAGGQSRRLPCYIPEGKIFAPVPVSTSSILPPTVLDLQLSLFLKFPWHKGETIITSGDVVIDFDVNDIPEQRGDICGFAKHVPFKQGSLHGVFKFESNRTGVINFYQKASEEFLSENAALEGTSECALDMGIIALSPRASLAFIEFGMQSIDKTTIASELNRGKINFDIYLEILTASIKGLDYNSFSRKISSRTSLSIEIQKKLFDIFSNFNLQGVMASSAVFLHMGSLEEYPASCLSIYNRELKAFYSREGDEIIPHCSPDLILSNSERFNLTENVQINSKSVYVESSASISLKSAAGNNLLVGLTASYKDLVLPEGICLDKRDINNSVVHLVYSIYDTFKPKRDISEIVFCNVTMERWLLERKLSIEDIWINTSSFDLYDATLYIPDSDESFLSGYFNVPKTDRWRDRFLSAKRYSLLEINTLSNAVAREELRIEIRKKILKERLINGIGWKNVSQPDFYSIAQDREIFEYLRKMYQKTDDELLKTYRGTLLNSLDMDSRQDRETNFKIDYISKSGTGRIPKTDVKEDQIVWVRSPIRLDLAGGWSDTPPYTLNFGGQVVNLAVNLNEQDPIQVFCRRTADNNIRIHSIDLGLTETISDFNTLADCSDPSSPFVLPKAAFCLIGFIQDNFPGKTLSQCIQATGSGIEITLLSAIPKGSGLGTSSILSAAILSALHRFYGQQVSPENLYRQVLQMEQMLTTGGGWQDQIGGVAGGVKYIESRPGLKPDPIVHQLDPWLFMNPSTHQCFTLFYTGITRLAKNILQDVVKRVNYRTPAYFYTLHYIRRLSQRAKEIIGLRNLEALADIISESWQANIRIHEGTTNNEVEALLAETSQYYRGAKLLGAGGGGYTLFLSNDLKEADSLRNLLQKRFENSKARIVDFSLNLDGLKVTVS